MKKLISVLFVMASAACGGGGVAMVPENHTHPGLVPNEHIHTDMVPEIHEHPEAEAVDPSAATGLYIVTGTSVVDTCNNPSTVSDDILDFGEWILATTIDGDIFFRDTLMLWSTDGTVFSSTESIETHSCFNETTVISATLTFTEFDLSGPIVLNHTALDCEAGVDENGDSIFEDTDCTRTWEFLGNRL